MACQSQVDGQVLVVEVSDDDDADLLDDRQLQHAFEESLFADLTDLTDMSEVNGATTAESPADILARSMNMMWEDTSEEEKKKPPQTWCWKRVRCSFCYAGGLCSMDDYRRALDEDYMGATITLINVDSIGCLCETCFIRHEPPHALLYRRILPPTTPEVLQHILDFAFLVCYRHRPNAPYGSSRHAGLPSTCFESLGCPCGGVSEMYSSWRY